jgi:phosphotransferase system enzyme I (PtsP)
VWRDDPRSNLYWHILFPQDRPQKQGNRAADWLRTSGENGRIAAMEASIVANGDRLRELGRIVREVDKAADLESALQVVVQRTRSVMQADVCTVYFSDDAKRRHVVAATDGISSGYVGNLAVDFGSGVIGKVAEERRPINLAHLPEDWDQGFLTQTEMPPHAGFLGVPILHKAQTQGVLLVRQRCSRRFDDADEAFLSTLASRLGAAIAYAKASGELCAACRPDQPAARCVEGRAGAPGIAMGVGVWAFSSAELQTLPDRQADDPEAEEQRFLTALAEVRLRALTLSSSLQAQIPEADRAMFDAFAMILDSPEIKTSVIEQIRQGLWAPAAVRNTFESYAGHFDGMDDSYLQQRASDVRALGARVLTQLLGEDRATAFDTDATILIGNQLSAMEVGEALANNLVGIVSADGASLSHAAILARSLGIPAVMGVSEVPLSFLDGQPLIVNGYTGRVHVRPAQATREAVEVEINRQRAQHEALEPIRHLPAETTDGKRINLLINSGFMGLPAGPDAQGSDGVGLFRSELPFMMFDRFPSESEQRDIYRQALAAIAPLPLVLRTLDAGGDKPLSYLAADEPNPALGWRGIRFTLDHPDIFLTQVRAALRANVGLENLRLLLPMVSALEEVVQVKVLVDQAAQQLKDEGLEISLPRLGAMIEVPAAVYLAESLAREVDFISVGTNDLVQYLLAMDRNNPRVSARLDVLHPALLHALRYIAEAVHRAGKHVTVCGEMASDPSMAMVLVGMGYDGLSVNPTALLQVKAAIRRVSLRFMQSLAAQVRLTDDKAAIRKLMDDASGRVIAPQPARNDSAQECREEGRL